MHCTGGEFYARTPPLHALVVIFGGDGNDLRFKTQEVGLLRGHMYCFGRGLSASVELENGFERGSVVGGARCLLTSREVI